MLLIFGENILAETTLFNFRKIFSKRKHILVIDRINNMNNINKLGLEWALTFGLWKRG